MRKCLVVVDYQNDFVSGALGSAAARGIEPALCAKIDSYRASGGDILFTMDTHGEDYAQSQEGRKLPVPHCLQGSEGWKLTPAVESRRRAEDPCFMKNTFGSAELLDYFREHPYDQIEFCGVVTNICVISNAVLAKAALPEAEIQIDAACVAGGEESVCREALDVMEGLQMTVFGRGKENVQ